VCVELNLARYVRASGQPPSGGGRPNRVGRAAVLGRRGTDTCRRLDHKSAARRSSRGHMALAGPTAPPAAQHLGRRSAVRSLRLATAVTASRARHGMAVSCIACPCGRRRAPSGSAEADESLLARSRETKLKKIFGWALWLRRTLFAHACASACGAPKLVK
jgi:hypothetical protein